MTADLRGRNCCRRKTEKIRWLDKSESRSPGVGTVGGGRLKRRWLDRMRADLQGEGLLAEED